MKIHRITLPWLPVSQPVNVYLVEGSELTLVDTGPKSHDAWVTLNHELERLDLRLQDVDKIVISHAHVDHCGGAGSVQRACRASVYAHPVAAKWLENPERELHQYFCVRMAGFLRRVGVPEAAVAESYLGAEMLIGLAEPAAVDGVLEEGNSIEMGGCDWKVIHTPGHAMSSICLLHPESGVMFCGDQLLLNVPSNPMLDLPQSLGEQRPHTLSIYLRSLQRLSAMEMSACFPGHGDTIFNHRAVIEERHKRHDRRKQLILEVLRDGPRTPYEIAREVVSSLESDVLFLGISDIVGHLDLLEEEGKVHQMDDDSVVYYETF